MTKYKVIILAPPGLCNVFNPLLNRSETVRLEDITDELADALFENGCQFLEPITIPIEETATKKKQTKSESSGDSV